MSREKRNKRDEPVGRQMGPFPRDEGATEFILKVWERAAPSGSQQGGTIASEESALHSFGHGPLHHSS